MELRYYLGSSDGGLFRLPMHFFRYDDRAAAFSQYAGTRQRIINAMVCDGDLVSLTGSFVTFNSKGCLDGSALTLAVVAGMEKMHTREQARREKLVDLEAVRAADESFSQHRFDPGESERNAIIAGVADGRRRTIPYLRAGPREQAKAAP